MAGHIQDRWYRTETGPDGKARKVKTERYGTGSRYRARYIGPDGTEKSKSFPTGRSGSLISGWRTLRLTWRAGSTSTRARLGSPSSSTPRSG